MNLRELAKKDAVHIIEGNQAGYTDCVLSDKSGNQWQVRMQVSDISYQVDTEGNRTAGRTCWATYNAARVKDGDGNVLFPRRGWQLKWTDINGENQNMFVSFCDPDRTIGRNRLFMTISLPEEVEDEQEFQTSLQ